MKRNTKIILGVVAFVLAIVIGRLNVNVNAQQNNTESQAVTTLTKENVHFSFANFNVKYMQEAESDSGSPDLDDAATYTSTLLSDYFSTKNAKAAFKIEQQGGYYTFSVTNLSLPDDQALATFKTNAEELIHLSGVNKNIKLYTFTASTKTGQAVTISYHVVNGHFVKISE